jgi:hypothetical protein
MINNNWVVLLTIDSLDNVVYIIVVALLSVKMVTTSWSIPEKDNNCPLLTGQSPRVPRASCMEHNVKMEVVDGGLSAFLVLEADTHT